ncbi:TRAP transporter small permease subunit [Loktanella sp. M215]|uniref:TRAP transporter small permease subunit n=1 Tax=Loktanella sp. M215 TaxID=2675431 RepID=UPI001F2681A5|nr:TRAP transporter small permease subunit [Loktanella sp. M215]MBU2359182.1 TRAP transporter small permease subunit [Alphaproteobacteria bacterium]MCF7697863.1 TRAP transporter small permease subunit [Loktanella sp. M215]
MTDIRKPEALGRVDRVLLRLIDALSAALMIVASIALMLMMVHVTVDVVGKFVFHRPVPMTLEMVSNYYMVAVVFLPFAAVERMNGNIHVELIYALLPRVARRLLDLISYVLFAALLYLLTTSSWAVAVKKYNVGEFIMGSYAVPIWPSRFLLPVGTALALALVVVRIGRTALLLVRADLDKIDDMPSGPADPVGGTNL